MANADTRDQTARQRFTTRQRKNLGRQHQRRAPKQLRSRREVDKSHASNCNVPSNKAPSYTYNLWTAHQALRAKGRMCQLLGMNCAAPTDFSFSLKGFCRRGGETDNHAHGFGLCLYEGNGIRCFHDTLPACKSPVAALVQQYPMRTYNMMAHIRYATQGEVSLENVHPFTRVWKGVQWAFAHNGECPKFSNVTSENTPLLGQTRPRDRIFDPVGDTDSEAVFCAILNALNVEFTEGLPTLPVLHEFLSLVCDEIIADMQNETIFNFLLGCGQYTLFAYSWPGSRPGSKVWNGLHYIVREPPFSTAKLLDADYSIDFATVTTPSDRVAVIATKPLTAEPGWTEFKKGELLLFNRGLPYRTPKCCEKVEQESGGLFSKHVKAKCSRSPRRVAAVPGVQPIALSIPASSCLAPRKVVEKSLNCTRLSDSVDQIARLSARDVLQTSAIGSLVDNNSMSPRESSLETPMSQLAV